MCLTVCLFVCLCLCLCSFVSDRSIGGLSICLRLSIYIYMCLHLSICVCLCLSIHLRLSLCCLRYLSVCVYYLSVYLYAYIYRIYSYLRLSATATVSIWPGLSVGRSTRLSVRTTHFVLCCVLRICEDMSFLSFSRNLVLLEECTVL